MRGTRPAWVEDDMEMVSDTYPIAMSPGGTLYMPPCETQAEQDELDRMFDAYLVERGAAAAAPPSDAWGHAAPPVPGDDGEAGVLEQFLKGDPAPEVAVPSGSKRTAAAVQSMRAFRCFYIGCMATLDDRDPITCPHPDEGQPDMEYPFCSIRCASAWAQYEVGDPLADRIQARIEQRAGHPVEPAPPYDLNATLAVLRLGDSQGTGAGKSVDDGASLAEERYIRNKSARIVAVSGDDD